MSKNSKVCVIMPVYNGEKTLGLALKSLLFQSYSNWVCVIVNDGSTDGTKNLLSSLTDKRFKVIHLPKNKGRGFARQVCLDNSEGEYLAYLDADDFWHEDKLHKQVSILQSNPDISLVGCRLLTFDAQYLPGAVRGSCSLEKVNYNYGEPVKLCMPTAMIRLREAKSFRYNPALNASEDLDYFSNYLDSKQYQNIPDILLYYSVTESTTYSKILEYTGFEIKRGFSMFRRNNKAALRIVVSSFGKWLIYACSIPILGTDFFLKRRGSVVKKEEIAVFNEQKEKLFNTVSL